VSADALRIARTQTEEYPPEKAPGVASFKLLSVQRDANEFLASVSESEGHGVQGPLACLGSSHEPHRSASLPAAREAGSNGQAHMQQLSSAELHRRDSDKLLDSLHPYMDDHQTQQEVAMWRPMMNQEPNPYAVPDFLSTQSL
jgi:hypothetical protein